MTTYNRTTLIATLATVTLDLSASAILTIYNDIAGQFDIKTVKRFSTKAAAFSRTEKMIEGVIADLPKEVIETPDFSNEEFIKTGKIVDVVSDSPKVVKAPKAPKFTPAYSWRRQGTLLTLLKKLTIENVKFGMGVVGANGDNDCLRDKISIKLSGTKTPLARIAVKLGENGLREIYIPENVNTLVLDNEDNVAVTQIVSYIGAALVKNAADMEAAKIAKEAFKAKTKQDKADAKLEASKG
jgi:hypothetical protein